jgi:hypothetical protein
MKMTTFDNLDVRWQGVCVCVCERERSAAAGKRAMVAVQMGLQGLLTALRSGVERG